MFYRFPRRWLIGLLLMTIALAGGPVHAADTTETRAKQIWQLLDYVAVDYGGAVANGSVLKESEFAEMQEFVATAERQLNELPNQAGKDNLLQKAAQLRLAVTSKADPASVAALAHALSSAVQTIYPFPVAPAVAPDLARGAHLFQAQCAACHGAQGRGDGPLAASLTPRPTALAERLRARERSLFALHQIISNGVQGTAMQSLVAATPSNLLVGETKPKKMTGVSADQMAKMEREMGNLQEQFKLAEQTYGQDILNLVLAKGYLAKLMANEAILRHLTKNHPDVLNEFDSIVRLVALDK